MKTKKDLEKEITQLKSKIVEEQEFHHEMIVNLNEELSKYEGTLLLDTSNLMELQKAELLVKAQKKFSLQELEDMFGGNSFDL